MYRTIEESELRVDKTLKYVYFLDKKHPLSSGLNVGKVYYHRHLMSIKLGRWLLQEEVVHHIDGNRSNNSIDNLEVLSNTEHARSHMADRVEANGDVLSTIEEYVCTYCKEIFEGNSRDLNKYCSVTCSSKDHIKDKDITKEVLQPLIDSGLSWVAMGKLFSYSDVGIKKRAKALGCTVPERKPRRN
jgi:hypothetical protein